MLHDLQIELLILKDIQYQLENAEKDLIGGFEPAANYRYTELTSFAKTCSTDSPTQLRKPVVSKR